MNVETMREQLKFLKLKTAALELDEILAKNKKAISLSWTIDLLEREIDTRKEKALQSRIKRAEFPEIKTLEGFDWKFNPKINQKKIEDLATLNFVKQNQIALFLGEPGVGKTHTIPTPVIDIANFKYKKIHMIDGLITRFEIAA